MAKSKQPRKPSRATLLANWSKEVRNRDGNVCVVYGKDQYVQAHHILPKHLFSYKPVAKQRQNHGKFRQTDKAAIAAPTMGASSTRTTEIVRSGTSPASSPRTSASKETERVL